jgi:hypothetical protein
MYSFTSLTDQSGIPLLSTIITSANTHDMKAAKDTLDNLILKRPSCKQNLFSTKDTTFQKYDGSRIVYFSDPLLT